MYRFRYGACWSKNNKHIPRHERHVKPLLTLQCFDGKICPAGPWHLFLKDCFPVLVAEKPGVSLLLSLLLKSQWESHSSADVSFQVQVEVGEGWGWECRWQDGLGGVCGSGRKGADGAVSTAPDLRFRRVKEIVTCVPRVAWEAWEGLFSPEDIFLTFTLRAEIQATMLSSRSSKMEPCTMII